MLSLSRVVLFLALALLIISNIDVTIQECSVTRTEPVVSDTKVEIAGTFQRNLIGDVASSPAPNQELVLRDSPGGNIYVMRAMAERFERIRVAGTSCTSACVMMLTTYDNVCIEPTVQRIRFHTISTTTRAGSTGYCLKYVNRDATLNYIDTLPTGLQSRIRALSAQDMIVQISLDEFLTYYPDKLCQ